MPLHDPWQRLLSIMPVVSASILINASLSGLTEMIPWLLLAINWLNLSKHLVISHSDVLAGTAASTALHKYMCEITTYNCHHMTMLSTKCKMMAGDSVTSTCSRKYGESDRRPRCWMMLWKCVEMNVCGQWSARDSQDLRHAHNSAAPSV